MIFQTSAHDGSRLPLKWSYKGPDSQQVVIDFLNAPEGARCPSWWGDMHPNDRRAVILHLHAKSLIPGFKPLNKRREGYRTIIEHLNASNDIMRDLPFTRGLAIPPLPTRPAFGTMLYDKPNGGKRMLPSMYGKLRDYWLRANGVAVNTEDMNNGHLENTIKLLKESHVNVQGRAQDLIGRMRHHYQNQPAIVEQIEKLHHMMDEVGVEDMYPIFEKLAEELASRLPPPIARNVVWDIETFGIDDDLSKW